MVSFPAIPTDNIYKFLTYSGMILVVIGIGGPIWLKYDRYVFEHQLTRESEERFRLNCALQLEILKSDMRRQDNIPKALSEFAVELSDREAKATKSRIDQKQRTSTKVLGYFELTLVAGLTVFIPGLILWLRVQRVQDRTQVCNSLKRNVSRSSL